MPQKGLCSSLNDEDVLFKIISPDYNDLARLRAEGLFTGYWGSGISFREAVSTDIDLQFDFTPLRQTIVLFMAAMNREL